MILRYLKNASSNSKPRPKHPLFCRSFEVDGELISANSYDSTSFDNEDLGSCLPVSAQVEAGMRLKPMGVAPSRSMLKDAILADEFVKRFNAAGQLPSAVQRQDVEVPSPPPSAPPAAPPAVDTPAV